MAQRCTSRVPASNFGGIESLGPQSVIRANKRTYTRISPCPLQPLLSPRSREALPPPSVRPLHLSRRSGAGGPDPRQGSHGCRDLHQRFPGMALARPDAADPDTPPARCGGCKCGGDDVSIRRSPGSITPPSSPAYAPRRHGVLFNGLLVRRERTSRRSSSNGATRPIWFAYRRSMMPRTRPG